MQPQQDPPAPAPVAGRPPGERDTRVAVDAVLLPSVFSGTPVAVVALDRDGAVTALTPVAERLLGCAEADLVGRPLLEHLHHQHPDGRVVPPADSPILAALEQARPAAGDGVFVRGDGSALGLAWAFAPTVLARTLVGGVLTFSDTAAQHAEAARQRRHVAAVEEANVRLALLAEVARVLGETDDVVAGLRALADLVVPVLADWVTVDVLAEDGTSLERVALTHRDPARRAATAARVGPLPPLRPGMTSRLAQVLHGATPQHQRMPPPDQLRSLVVDDLAAERVALGLELGASEWITAPLRARGRTLGAITLVRADGSRPYRAEDLDFAADLAARAGTLLDTTRVLSRQVSRAEQMQRALLPDLTARIGPLELAGLYQPASDLAQVGGDWYDAFVLPDESTGLVIGDVAGHDLHAATRMGAIRHKLRALAGDRIAPPSDVVARLDRVLQRFAPDDLATAVYARLDTTPRGPRLQWSNAGHPPPLLLTGGRPPRLLDDVVDLPLGVADLDRTDAEVHLGGPGGQGGAAPVTLVLYSDGLVERPGESLTAGLRRLLDAGADLAGVPLADVGPELLARLDPTGLDDIAVLTARLGPPGAG
ncbi:SpoIIE family protein phosphatase [Kineococcus aurantiacus]|uniref:PAS domain-containing protein n=1 Tax=Kineococcus aurantiacus TaxID=37633 RepID=A0A7Y9DLD3_9ACTN|nr:PAS domain-containing protein [Kineococcus aurantiacus]